MSIRLNLMTAAYSVEAEEPLEAYRDYDRSPHLRQRAVVHLFCRDKDGNRVVVRDWRGSFKPYFYVPTRKDNKEGMYDFFGRYVKRIEVELPGDVPAARERFEFSDEADILFEKRFQIDKRIRCGLKVTSIPHSPALIEPAEDLPIQPRRFYYDIEVAAKGDIDVKSAQYPVVLITVYDSYTDTMTAFLNRPSMITVKELKLVIARVEREWKDLGTKVDVVDCPNEFQTVLQFVEMVRIVDPDQLLAHNGDRFDFPYLYYRCRTKRWRIMRRLSPLGKCYMKGDYPVIAGREHIDFCGDKAKHDGLYTNFTVQDTDIDSVRLGEIAEHELSYTYRFGKIGYLTYDLWHSEDPSDIFKFVFYGLEDTWVMFKIDEKKGMSNRYEVFRRIYGCTVKDALSNSLFIDMAALRLADKPLPTKIKGSYKKDKKEKLIEGALVIRPRAGIHGVMNEDG